MELLNLPISSFLSKIRTLDVEARMPVLSVSAHHTLEYFVEKVQSTKVHRLFIAEDKNGFVPERVVSISDFLKYIVA
jgi:hypothetical protein